MTAIAAVPSKPVDGVDKHLWETVTESDTATAVLSGGTRPVAGSVQMVGTWGGATGVLQGSNDGGTTWADLNDTTGTAISLTADGYAEFTSAAIHLRVSFSGGTGQDLDVHLSLRG